MQFRHVESFVLYDLVMQSNLYIARHVSAVVQSTAVHPAPLDVFCTWVSANNGVTPAAHAAKLGPFATRARGPLYQVNTVFLPSQ